MTSDPCPVVLCFPDHSFFLPFQGQHGQSVPPTSAAAPLEGSRSRGLSWPVAIGSLFNERRQESYASRYRGLRDAEYLRPDFLYDILPKVAAGNYERFPER